ncbi:MAG: hypothetical protein WB615_15900 [Candidatus Tumulicola sp.]
MTRTSRYRLASFAAALVINVALLSAAAPAEIEMVIGARTTVTNEPVSDCSAKAKTALNTVLQNAFEAGDGTGQWLAYGPLDSSGHSSATAAIHCYPLDTGYYVTITCAVEVPPNPDTATGLCTKLAAAFPAQKTASAATPSNVRGGAPWR